MNLKTLTDRQITETKPFLDELVAEVEQPTYIAGDPVLFMHAFEDKTDRELAGFFAALMAWGRRDIIIAKVEELLERMGGRPAGFTGNFSERDAKRFEGFKHRTFKPVDIYWLVRILKNILARYGDFESFWSRCYKISTGTGRELMAVFHEEFFNICPDTAERTRKHISNPEKNSSCKRLYLYLRWCLRKGSTVDPGSMTFMSPSRLKIPLDVHVARNARALGLLSRRYNDWKAVEELTGKLRLLDPEDPARYDYALFGMGTGNREIPQEYILNPSVL